MSTWIPAEEVLPPAFELVMVWTDYSWTFPEKMRITHPSWVMTMGFVDEDGDWSIRAISGLKHQQRTAFIDEPGHGILSPINVLFWMSLPPPPVGMKYPPMKSALGKKLTAGVTQAAKGEIE